MERAAAILAVFFAPIVREVVKAAAPILINAWIEAIKRSREVQKETPNAEQLSATADFDADIDRVRQRAP